MSRPIPLERDRRQAQGKITWTGLKIEKGHRLSPISFSEKNWRPQPDLNPARCGMQAPAVVPHGMRDLRQAQGKMSWAKLKIEKGHRLSPISFSEKKWRPQPDLNRCCRRERLMMLYITISHKGTNTAAYGLPSKFNGAPLGYSLTSFVHV